jgi:hypothetical protein
MRRPLARAALALALGGALGCQDYTFNPVGHCVIQPGTERVTLSNISTADVLFVVDDSGSMEGEQGKLAAAFDAFIANLDGYNQNRVAIGIEPFDFHIAVTTTSVFYNPPSSATCQATCGSATNVCCSGTTTPVLVAKACPAGNECGAGFSCKTTCQGYQGDSYCCDAAGTNVENAPVACTSPGAACGNIQERYVFPRSAVPCSSDGQCDTGGGYTCSATSCGALTGRFCCSPANQPQLRTSCKAGIATEGTLYPHGNFVGLGTNPRVLHFDKQLYGQLVGGTWTPVDPLTAKNKQGFTRTQLKDYFKTNVNVGTCGSGQEQGLQAGRLAVSKALAGKQRDLRDAAGAEVAAPGITADWPHQGAKLVVAYIGDEDDCSSPDDPFRGVMLSGLPGNDTCVADAALPLDQQKEFRVDDIASGLAALGRPLGAAYVVSTAEPTCVDEACTPGLCCDYACTGSQSVCRDSVCGGQGAGSRFLDAAGAMRRVGADVIEGSICDPGTAQDPGFAPILIRIADIVKPPSALQLPTQPADTAVTLLRIARPDGSTRKRCNGPAKPPLTFQQARDQGYDWWFTATRDQVTDVQKTPSDASRFIYINHATLNCEAGPGETYAADYLGLVPQNMGCTSDANCAAILGGKTGDWTCFAGLEANGTCTAPAATATGGTGTCLCGERASVCPNG